MTAGETVDDVRNAIVIGSGPSGYTAAIYLARAGLQPLVFEGAVTAGGALMNTTDVENFPGFPDGIMGPELMENLRKQAERFGAELVTDDVTEVDLTADPKVVKVGADTYYAKTVVLAMGSAYRELGIPGERELSGHGVSWCATCDGFFFREQDIAVVGGGDSALEEAPFLTRFARKVYLVHRRDSLRASKIMQQRALDNPKIRVVWNSEVADVLGDDVVTELRLRDTRAGEEREEETDGLFLAIGYKPNTDAFRDRLEVDQQGYLVVHDETRTKIEGVFVAGDVHDHRYRQAVTAAADGCKAAIDAERWLEAQGITEAATATAW